LPNGAVAERLTYVTDALAIKKALKTPNPIGCLMKIFLLGLLGLVLGAIAGGAIGLVLGLIWTSVFHTSCFEGYCGMLVFFTFMPIGLFLGALVGGIGFGIVVARAAR
jgi:hypothetical protein